MGNVETVRLTFHILSRDQHLGGALFLEQVQLAVLPTELLQHTGYLSPAVLLLGGGGTHIKTWKHTTNPMSRILAA